MDGWMGMDFVDGSGGMGGTGHGVAPTSFRRMMKLAHQPDQDPQPHNLRATCSLICPLVFSRVGADGSVER